MVGRSQTDPHKPPPTPQIFFGREEIVQQIVSIVMDKNDSWQTALLGAGGIGKSSIAKAILNHKSIVKKFPIRIFVTYDGVDSSAMNYQLFLERLSTVLGLRYADAPGLIRYLGSKKALLVVDNAETFKHAPDVDAGLILEFLDTIGAQKSTRIIITSRNTEVIPPNLRCQRIPVSGLSLDAACHAFTAVYHREDIDDSIRTILKALEFHPLSINLLANAATMNQWSIEEIGQAWSERQTGVLDNANDKYRSLRVATEISIVSFKDKTLVLQILRAIAFLPQGIHRSDFPSVFPSIPDVARKVEAIQRSSLIYRNGNRLTMLAPIRMYIADQYNQNLPYNDHVLSCIRGHYHSNLSDAADNFVEREHGNIDRLMHFDMTSSLYQSDIETHSIVLDKADEFLSRTTVQPTSLWQLLVAETHKNSFSSVDSLAQLISVCLAWICVIDYYRDDHNEALGKLEVAEAYCRDHSPVCNERLVRCLQLKSYIFQHHRNLILATEALEEGSSIAQALEDFLHEALLNESLAGVLLLQGKVTEATSLHLSAQEYFEANNQYGHLISLLIGRSYTSISRNDFTNARLLVDKAMELDQLHNGGRDRLSILYWKASSEGWAGDGAAALKMLQEATEVEVPSGTSQFRLDLSALRGRAYYEARMGRITDARNSIARVFELRRESGKRDFLDCFISALIANFAGESAEAISMIRKILDQHSGNDRQITAVYHRTLAEILLIEGKHGEDRAQFTQAKAICDETGISPKHLYVNKVHWYSLPVEYDGWERFLADAL